MVSALFVDTKHGPYPSLGLDCWDEARDAREYNGSNPIVAHPPCKRWGRYWNGGPSAKTPRKLGDDGGCFASAFRNLQRVGGVIEHPEASHAWAAFGIPRPGWRQGWVKDGDLWSCCVSQHWYGHAARKLTWLAYVGNRAPFDLDWRIPEPGTTQRLDRTNGNGYHRGPRTKGPSNHLTPTPFACLLVRLAEHSRL